MTLDPLDQFDLVAGLKRHHSLLPAATAAFELAHALPLAFVGRRADGRHLDIEHLLHRLADLHLVGVQGDLEGHRVELLLLLHALLGHQRANEYGARVPHFDSASCRLSSAAFSNTTRWLRRTWYTEAWDGVSTWSHPRLRAARSSASLRSDTTRSVGPGVTPRAVSRAESALVLGSVTSSRSTTDTSPDATLAAMASRSAARRISMGMRLSYFRGVGPNGLPPPFHWVARMEPWRARPVPFCRHGLRPPPDTSLRPLVSWVPARRAASSRTTAWGSSGTRTLTPKTFADSSSVSLLLPFPPRTGTLGILLGLFRLLLLGLGLFHALPHEQQPTGRAGDGPAQQDQVLLWQHPHHRQIEHGAAVAAHAARQMVAREDARRI